MAILKNGKVDSGAWQKLVLSLNRGGLWSVILCQQYIFFQRLEIISDNPM